MTQELIPVKPSADWGLTRGGAHCQWLWGCLAWSLVLTKSAPRQLVTPATTATARPRRSCSGRRYRAPFCSGFAATASWKTRASSGGGGSSCGGRDRRRRPNRRRPEFGCGRVRRCCSQTRELRRWRGSMGRGKHNGFTPVTKWSPGFRRSRARAAVVFGLDGIGGQSEQKRTGVGVNDGGAYRGSIGGPIGSGETSEVVSGRRRSRAAGDGEDGLSPSIAGYGGIRGMACGCLGVWRSSGVPFIARLGRFRRRPGIRSANRHFVVAGRRGGDVR